MESLCCPCYFSHFNFENLFLQFWQSCHHESLKINNLKIHCKCLHQYSHSPWKPYAQESEQFHCSSHFHTCFQHQSKVQPQWRKKKVILPANSFITAFSLTEQVFKKKKILIFKINLKIKKINYESTKALRHLCPDLSSRNSC